jgi:cytochrome P450
MVSGHRTPRSSVGPRFKLPHRIGAWYDAEAYFRRRARAGKAFAMPIPGMGEVLFAAHRDDVREFLKMPTSIFTPPMPNPIEPVVGRGSIILLDGQPHKAERARFLPALHGEAIRRHTDLMAGAVTREIDEWKPGDVIDARDVAQSITLQIIVRAVFGIDDDRLCREYVRVVKAMMRNYIAPFMFFPALRRAPLGLGPWRRFSEQRVALDRLLREQIARRRADGSAGREDVLAVLLSDDEGSRDDEEVLQQLRTLLVSGHETSATTLGWALYHIHNDERVASALTEELAAAPSLEALSRAPFLGAVINETLRLHPTVSIVVRQLKKDARPWDIERRAGDVIGIALPALHADPHVYTDPSRFDPWRFIDAKPSPSEFSPFGYGHRRCPGAAFAAQELAIALGLIMTSVELEPVGTRSARSIPRGVAAVPRYAIRLRVVRRLGESPLLKGRAYEAG